MGACATQEEVSVTHLHDAVISPAPKETSIFDELLPNDPETATLIASPSTRVARDYLGRLYAASSYRLACAASQFAKNT